MTQCVIKTNAARCHFRKRMVHEIAHISPLKCSIFTRKRNVITFSNTRGGMEAGDLTEN